ncbi:MAG: hypothetical protein JNG83_12270 [Opitutaceae bacterium]|nr:hypothetical protein [Opitutaceae bacterium]
MSLINEALKKAQKQRTGESAPLPSVGGVPAARIAKRGKPAAFHTVFIRAGIGAAIAVVLVVGGLVAYRLLQSPPAVATAPAANSAPAATPQAAAPAPVPAPVATVTPPPKAETPAPAPTAAAASFTVPAPAPAAPPAEVHPAPKAAATPAVVFETPKLPAAPPPKMSPRAVAFIESLRIAGIRTSATDSKVLMNDRVFRIGNVVEHELGIKLTGISSSSLTFEDEQGAAYVRQF